MEYERIDSLEVNYPDVESGKKLRLAENGISDDKRLFIGHKEEILDEFFYKDGNNGFFFLKEDLIDYMQEAKEEYYNPTQEYRNNISEFYEENLQNTLSIADNIIRMNFTKTYNTCNRYYLVLEPKYKKQYDYARNIMLPRITKLRFVKIRNKEDGKIYIYIKPVLQNFIQKEKQIEIVKENEAQERIEEIKQQKIRDAYKQQQYRLALFEKMPCCIFTLCSDDRVLNACHIKPYKICEKEGKIDEEGFDVKNGITMTPTYHLLFDNGFISFSKDGKLLLSPYLSNMNRNRLNLVENKQYQLQKGSEKYLLYHQQNIFNQLPKIEYW